MADDKTLKPKSFRINDETADKFKEISATIGNQQETLAKLIEAYEFQAGKAVLTDKKSDIEQFERYVSAITRMYMGSLEDNQNISETIRTEFEALLKSKDATIQDLQEKIETLKQSEKDAAEKSKLYSDENIRLNQTIDSMNNEYNSKIDNMQTMLEDKDNLNKALTDSCNELKTQLDSIKDTTDKLKAVETELYDIKQEKTELERKIEQSHLEFEKRLLEEEKKHNDLLQELKADKQAEIDKYQQKYFELLEQLQNNSHLKKEK